ncbi:MAG: ABC transporter permease [Bryobacteraceae bacterium]
MRIAAYFRSVAARLFRRTRRDDDLEQELRSHIEHRADDLERSGLTRVQAERQARIEFGGRGRFQEECYEALGGNFVETLIQDVRYGVRVLRKSPGFTAVAVLTLALAIGANAVVFGVMNGMVLRPLNVPEADSLYGIEHGNEHSMYQSYPDYLDLRDRNRSFDGLAGFTVEQVALDTGKNPALAWVNAVSGNYFDVLKIQPYLGRFFHTADEHGPDSAPYIVLGYAYWRTHFGADPSVTGRIVRLNKYPYTVLGVTPPEFHGTILIFSPDAYVPLVNQRQLEGKYELDVRARQTVFMTLGHLKAGVDPKQAVADLNSIGVYLEKTYPKEHGKTTFKLARPGLYGNYFGEPLRAFVAGLMLLAGLVLLASCANLGSLFGARAADRSREVALRLALGASRGRIMRQFFTEAVLIAIAGGAAGLWGGVALLRALNTWRPISRWPVNMPVSPDGSVYLTALVLALISGVLCGIVPVRQALRSDPNQVVKAGRGGLPGRRLRARDLLLAVQIAICAVLVTSSVVAVRGLARTLHSQLGFEPRSVLLADTDLSMSRYAGEEVPAMQQRMIHALETIPGVQRVGLIGRIPLHGGGFSVLVFTDRTADLRPSNAAANALRFNVSPEYFDTAGTVLLAGRAFSWHDGQNSPQVAVINHELATKLFGSVQEAVGSHFLIRDGTRIEVVGVVEDGKYMNLTEDPEKVVFRPFLQVPSSETWLLARSDRDPEQLAAAIRTVLHGMDAGLPVYIQSWTEQLNFALFPSRMATVSLGVMGGIGAVLAITGVFGMAAYSVSRRLKELGIRMALGADWRELLGAALGRAFQVLAFGSAAGLLLGLVASRVLAYIVYQATPRDPVVLASVVLVMLGLGLVATWIPAQRALSVDPVRLLRED